MSQTAKVFLNGRSQAVRLPAAFRFDSDEVFIRRDAVTGDVILSRKPESWDGFVSLLKNDVVPSDFLGKQERDRAPAAPRDPFEGMDE
jgi:antitoxin VapB